MKRDLDLVRSLLLEIEKTPAGKVILFDVAPTAVTDGHLLLMKQQGLIKIEQGPSRGSEGEWYMFAELTWSGHDFVDSVRDEAIWQKTKDGVKAVGGFSFDVVKALAKGLIKTKLEKHTGLEIEI